jgi:di/tricarboxylate transporter
VGVGTDICAGAFFKVHLGRLSTLHKCCSDQQMEILHRPRLELGSIVILDPAKSAAPSIATNMGLPPATHPYIAVGVTFFVFVVLQARRRVPTDLLFLLALLTVTLTGIITPEEALRGFANPAPITVAALLIVAAGLRSAGVLDSIGQAVLGRARTERQVLVRLALSLVASSAFLLNTAVVAMTMPAVIDWCRRHNLSPSRFLIPLSYLTILGGVCTLVGTSTTLVANGILREEQARRTELWADADVAATVAPDVRQAREEFLENIQPLGLFELGYVGLPCAVVGGVVLILLAPRLLPKRTDIVEQLGEQRREYLVEMLVQNNCPLIDKTVEDAGLRQLPGLFLIEIDRRGEVITPVTPNDVIRADDRLVFTGIVDTIVDLEKIPGLVPAADLSYEVQPSQRAQRRLTEVVLSPSSPLIGFTVRDANFRQRYNAAVVAVHRNGIRLSSKIGTIQLAAGDTLLLQTRTEFVSTYRNSGDFYLVSSVEGSEPRSHHKMKLALSLAGVLVVLLCLTTWLGNNPAWTAVAALTIVVAMVVTRCLTMSEARNSLDLQLVLTIIAALGLGRAISASGAAYGVATWLVDHVGAHPELLLIVIYLLAIVFTETITNNAVAAMLLPIAIDVASVGHYNPRPFVIAITLAASLSFITPIGYQTNLMVMGPGGYRPLDFLRCGIPLAIAVMVTSVLLIPQIWHF